MATLHGTIIDAATNEPIDAKVHVLGPAGEFHHPRQALLKRGPGTPFFFAAGGEFEVDVGRGHLLTAQFDPDWPPLCAACDDARDQGGLVIWCHNSRGMEAPVTAALGKLDAFNLFDPFWMDPEYDLWYRLLDCGLRLPASTGTDWFVCSNNRVYVHTEKEFSYANWIDGMKKGRTFVTNGPAIDLTVNDAPIGATLPLSGGGDLDIEVTFQSHYPVDAVEIVVDGKVVHRKSVEAGGFDAGDFHAGVVRCRVLAERDGWIAGRLWGRSRDSFDQSLFAHTSPVWFSCGRPPAVRADSARFFLDSIDASLRWIDTVGRYNSDAQREEVRDLFRRGREVYAGLTTT